jgi:phosphohistidine phosphatase
MKLIIMRHGQAVPNAASDSERSLTAKGEKDAFMLGKWLINQRYEPEVVLISPYLRARQTAAQVLAQTTPWSSEEATWITPEGSPLQVIKLLSQRPESSIMLVSHQPLVSNLLALLVDEQCSREIPFTPATIVILEGDAIALGVMQLVNHGCPEVL